MNNKFNKNETVIIVVRGGVSESFYAPENIDVIIVDYDNLKDGDHQCPVCEKPRLVNGVCKNCGFDTNNLTNNLE